MVSKGKGKHRARMFRRTTLDAPRGLSIGLWEGGSESDRIRLAEALVNRPKSGEDTAIGTVQDRNTASQGDEMPEGPEIKRLADAIEGIVGGEEVLEVEIAASAFKRYEKDLLGKRVEQVEPRGKATIFRFEGDYNVFTHLKLYGRWVFVGEGEKLDTTRQVKFGLMTKKGGVYLCSSPDVTVLHDEDVEQHPYLAKLGPDVINDASVTTKVIEERLGEKKWSKMPLGKLLLDQSFAAGIGNYLRSEILFVAKLLPEAKAVELDDAKRSALAHAILELPRRSYHEKGVTTPDAHVAQQKALGKGREDYRFFVYKRAGEACIECGETIEERTHGSRRIFVCPGCQA